jgi:hypothetical protein
MQMTERMPVAGLRALLGNSLDYAGLFPPASLPLDTAVRNYAKYRVGLDVWFLSHFVCPVNLLGELDGLVPLFAKSAPLLVSALSLPSSTWRELIPKLEESLDLIFRFQQSHTPRVRVDSIEVALPADLTQAAGRIEIRDLIPAAAETVELGGLTEITPFFEVTAPDWGGQAGGVIEAISEHNRAWNGVRCRPAAFKLRAGGLKAEAFPTSGRVAFVIQTCLETGVAFKCTAGLHHPVRHYDQSVATTMHGFLNIFGAAALIHARALFRTDLPSILEDEDASHFRFDEHGFTWNGVRATVEQISEARRMSIVSFGSCSFDEPLEDLRALGLL